MLTPASYIDHTLLKPETTPAEIAALCEEAVECGFASVCVPPRFVRQAAAALYGSEVKTGTVVGFPFGYETSLIKAEQTSHAVQLGAEEVDMVIPLGAARMGNFAEVAEEIRTVVARAGGRTVKVILECCLFDGPTKRALVEAAVTGGADYVKTSTGFGKAGAVLEDVRLLSEAAAGRVKVKAAGGIRDWPSCQAFIEAGAARIGTSAGVVILKQWSGHAR
jgi:deoxyribose-phosphate aldolase